MYAPVTFWNFLAQMKGIRQEIGKGSNGLFHDSTTEILILFDDVPQAIILVLPGLWYQGRRQAHCWFETIAVVIGHSRKLNFKVAKIE